MMLKHNIFLSFLPHYSQVFLNLCALVGKVSSDSLFFIRNA